MSYKEREQYGDKLLGAEAKLRIEPMLNKYNSERNNAGNFWQFLNVVTKEQEAYKEIYSNHRFALRALDRKNGDLKFSTIASLACQMDKKLSTNGIIAMLGFAVKNNIVSKDKIIKEINLHKGDLSSIYYHTNNMCDDYKSEQAKNNIQKQHALEKGKQQKLTSAQSAFHRVILSFDNEPQKDTRKTIESFGIQFNKFRQEWSGNVKEHNLTKLTKSLENEKCDIHISFKEEYSNSTKVEKQQAMKIDKGFSM